MKNILILFLIIIGGFFFNLFGQYTVKVRIGEITISNPIPEGHEWKCVLYADVFNSSGDLIQPPSGTTYYWEQDVCNGSGFNPWSSSVEVLCDGMISQTYQPKCDYTLGFQTFNVIVTVTINGNAYYSEIIRVPDNYSGTITQTKVTVRQKRNNQSSVGYIGKKIDNGIFNYPTNFIFYLPSNIGQEIFRASQDLVINPYEKYINWQGVADVVNHRSFSVSGSIKNFTSQFNEVVDATIICHLPEVLVSPASVKFEDPWFINDSSDPLGPKNKGMSADILSLPVTQYNIGVNSNYKGVFLNQGGVPPNLTPPYYSVKVDAVQDIPFYNTGVPTGNGRTHKFYFQNWGRNIIDGVPSAEFQDTMALLTPVVFKNENAVVIAKLKGTQLSSQTNAYNYNSQRKYAKTEDGYLHLVYESMGSVWYEVSPDNGATWKIQNNGRPLSLVGKQPSIDFNKTHNLFDDEIYQTVIIWQEKAGIYSKIKMAYFDRVTDTFPFGIMNLRDTKDLSGSISGTYETTNCTPVVSFAFNIYTAVFKNGSTGKLVCRYHFINANEGTISVYGYPIELTGTNIYSVNPSIAVNKVNGPAVLVWEQIQDVSNSSIKYGMLSGSQISGSIATISTGSTYQLNFSPSLSFAYNKPIVSWTVGTSAPGGSIINRKAATTVGTNWGSIFLAGTDVNYVNNNSASGTVEKTVMAWSQGTTTPITKWMRRSNSAYMSPVSLSNSGYQSQVCNGSDLQTMSAMVFKNTTVPCYFLKSTTDFSLNYGEEIGPGLDKIMEDDTIVTFGRSGVASINDIEFVFEIGDVLVGDSIIKFIEIPDTLVYTSTNELNQHTRTNNFSLTPETNFYFSNIYFVVQKSNPDSALTTTDAVNFKAELVNTNTNQVVGTFDNITYNKNNLEKYASIDYSVDCSGIIPGDYYLRLVTNANGNANYSLANIINDNTTLAKKNFNKVNFTGSEIPTTYNLAQNYPNPFNPSTTIRYQLPQDGLVTLKIYDILGSEVATLVNEEKVAGKYEVNFNASSLASGVYIYKIQAGSFINSKKMILLK